MGLRQQHKHLVGINEISTKGKKQSEPEGTPYSASKASISDAELARVHEKSIMEEKRPAAIATLRGPIRWAISRGIIRPKIEQPLLMASLGDKTSAGLSG